MTDKETIPQTKPALSSYQLDRYFLGAVLKQEKREIEAAIREKQEYRDHLVRMRRYQSEADEHVEQYFASQRSWFQKLLATTTFRMTLASLGMLTAVWLGRNTLQPTPDNASHTKEPNRSHTTIRGSSGISIIRKRGAFVKRVPSGSLFQNGDQLRIVVEWPHKDYLFIVHRIARQGDQGTFSAVYPKTESSKSLPLESNKEISLPGSLEVQGPVEGNEELWACFSKEPRSFETVTRAIRGKKNRSCQSLQRYLLKRKAKSE